MGYKPSFFASGQRPPASGNGQPWPVFPAIFGLPASAGWALKNLLPFGLIWSIIGLEPQIVGAGGSMLFLEPKQVRRPTDLIGEGRTVCSLSTTPC